MNNRIFATWILFAFLTLETIAQTLTVSSNQLSFGNVYENSPDSLQLTISNNTGSDVTVTNIRFYDTYNVPAFSSNASWFVVSNNSFVNLWVKFTPRHNIFHNSEMVIENNSLRGNISVDLIGQGKYSNNYYALSENLSEENLKTVLGVITGNGYVSLGYNIARDSMFMSFDNKRVNGQGASQNTLECVYTGRQAVGYTSRADCQTTFSFNTEHTFPQSFFSSLEPMRSDLHHLFPTDDLANNRRGDDPFGVVSNPTWNVGGSMSDGFTFEPRDIHKGASARALFYFVLRYQNYNNFVTSQESILRTWYWNFLPSTEEIARNNDINIIQHNRNPFVDYPVFLERIQSITSNSIAPVVSSLDLPVDTIVFGTIPTNINITYNYVIVNNGNVPINLSNFSLTNPTEMTFATPAIDTSLAPGEGLNIGITCNTSVSDSIHAFLTYNSNALGHTNVSVPIFVNDSIYNAVEEVENIFNVFPNPAHDFITLSVKNNSDIRWTLLNISGQALLKGSSKKIDLHHLTPGVYILNLNGSHRMIIVE